MRSEGESVHRAVEVFKNSLHKDSEGQQPRRHPPQAGIYHVYVQLKNRKQQRQVAEEEREYSLRAAIVGLFKVALDWVLDIIIALLFFLQGRYYVGALALFFVFVGGTFVTVSLNVLIKRKGDKEFKKEIEETSPFLLKLMYVPSLLPFFSAGLNLYLTNKYRKATSEEERKDLRRRLKICEEHVVTDALFESTFEAIPQAILQGIILLEKSTAFTRWIEFIPVVGVTSAWFGIAMVPIQMAKALNNIDVRIPEVIAGLGNRAVTLLSFVFFISAARKEFADPQIVTWSLVGATLVSILILACFSELPGLLSFQLDVKAKKGKWIHTAEQVLSHCIWVVIPIASFCFWGLTLYKLDEIHKTRHIVVTSVFVVSFGVSLCGCLFERKLPWLGQFSTDILLLIYMALTSYYQGTEFQDIDFQFEPAQQEGRAGISEVNNNESNMERVKDGEP